VEPAKLLGLLEQTAARLGIKIRYEVLAQAALHGSGGGLCRLKGQHVILIDERLGNEDRIAIIARALSSFDLETLYLTPAVRDLIATHARRAPAEARPPPGPIRPLARIRKAPR
jgi:hypothetical protein